MDYSASNLADAMGRLSNGGSPSPSPRANRPAAPPHTPGVDPWITHFSHRHHLELTSLDQSLTPPICAGCNSRVSGTAYSCKPCNYVLDDSCAKMPRRVRHPAHPHSVNIHAVAPGTEGSATNCAACGRASAGFVFKCDQCSYEMHCQCAAKPLSVKHRGHAHQLSLIFAPPYDDKVFSCDLCHGAGTDHWLYRCAGCEFDAHIGCATSAAPTAHSAPQPPAAVPRPPAVHQQASPRPSAAVQEQGPRWRPHARPQQASRQPPFTQQQIPQRPLGPQHEGWPRPLWPQQQYRPPAPGLLQPPGLQQQPPQTNQVNQGLGSGADQNDYDPTKADAAQGGADSSDSSGSNDHSKQDGSDDEAAPNQMNNIAQQQGPRRQQRQGRRRPLRPQQQVSPWRPVPQQPAAGLLRPPWPLRQQQQLQQHQPPQANQQNQGPDSSADQKNDDTNDDERDGNCSNQQDGDDDQDGSNSTIKMELSVNYGAGAGGSSNYPTGDGGDQQAGGDYAANEEVDCSFAGDGSNYGVDNSYEAPAECYEDYSFAGDGSNYEVDVSFEAPAECCEDYSYCE